MFALQTKTGTYLFYDRFDVTRKGGNCDQMEAWKKGDERTYERKKAAGLQAAV